MVTGAIRVAIDSTPLLGARTGVGVFVAGAMRGLSARPAVGLEAYALSWRGRRGLARLVPEGVELSRVPLPAGPLLRAWAHAEVPPVEWWAGRVDVVHGTNFVVPPARRAARVVTVHDLTSVRFPELCAPASLAYPGLVRRALRHGAMVHTPSEAVAAEVVELLGAAPERVRAVPHGLDAPVDGAPPDPARARYVLALGTVEPRKDLVGLVRAFDAVARCEPDLELVIAGPAGWGEEDLRRAIAAASHRGRIRRSGWVSAAERASLLRGAAVFCYPSRYEGFGLPPLEAMAAGVPVVASRAGAIPEVVGDAALLVAPGDAEALAAAIASVLGAGPGERASMTEAGRRQAARFSWDRCAEGLEALYREAMACAS